MFLLLIPIVGLLAITWFRGDFIINVGDFGFPLTRNLFFYKTLFFWDHSISMGYPAPGQLAFLIPYSLCAFLTEKIGISLVGFEKLLFYFWFTFSGLSMYYFCSVLKFKKITRLFASLFYMMNPYSLQILWHLASGMLLPGYIVTPIILGLFMKSLNPDKPIRYIIGLSIIWFFLGTYAYANPAVAVVHWVIVFSYLFYYLLINRRIRRFCKQAICKTAALLLLWVSFNIFWLLPYLNIIYQQSASVSSPSLGFISNIATFRLNSADILGALRLGGLWSLHGKWDGIPYYIWADKYSTIPFILISFLIPLFVFVSVFLINKKCKEKMESIFYLSILAIIGIFLVKGAKPPLGTINIWVYKHIPFLGTAFRANIQKWGLLTSFSFAPLLGLGINTMSDYLKIKFNKNISLMVVSLTIFLLFFVYAFPFWNGQVIFEGGGSIPSARIKVPSYYPNLKHWIAEQKNEYRIFSLPLSKNSNAIYKWQDNGYAGGDIIRWFSTKPVIYENCGRLYQLPILIAINIEDNTNIKLEKLFSLLNVKYLLIHRDTNWDVIKNHPWWINHNLNKIEQAVKNQKSIKFNKKFGKLYLYRLDDRYFLPLIYPITVSTTVAGDIKVLVQLTETKYLDKKPVLIFTEQDENRLRLVSIGLDWFDWLNNLVVKDSTPEDLGVQFSQLLSWQVSEFDKKKQEEEFKIDKAGVYEVYVDADSLTVLKRLNWFGWLNWLKIKVDGKELALGLGQMVDGKNRKYIKIGEVELEEGKHTIQVTSFKLQMTSQTKKAKIILVNKEEREMIEKEIWQKLNQPETEVCYIFEKEKGEFYVP